MIGKALVAYFSASGRTARVAEKLAEAAGADLYEIKPAIPYANDDLDWTNPNSRSSVEMNNLSIRPEMADKDANIGKYDTIFLGFPIWWHIAPTIINTFLESYDFSGKKIIVFATSGGSGIGDTEAYLKKSVSDSACFKGERLLHIGENKSVLERWIDSFDN